MQAAGLAAAAVAGYSICRPPPEHAKLRELKAELRQLQRARAGGQQEEPHAPSSWLLLEGAAAFLLGAAGGIAQRQLQRPADGDTLTGLQREVATERRWLEHEQVAQIWHNARLRAQADGHVPPS